jgi:hypothetical protein
MAVKSYIPGTTVSVGYESETADRATIRCLVTGKNTHTEAIEEAKTSVGETLYPGTYNVPLVSADASPFGNAKWIVSLNYGRGGRSRRRNQTERRIRIKSSLEYVDAYLLDGGSYTNGYRDNSNPDTGHWFSLQLRPGNKQTPELAPRPYKVQRPMMTIQLEYTTPFLTINDAELSKNGKINSNVFPIPEIGGVFAVRTLRYEGFESGKSDIGTYPWFTSLILTYDPAGHYRQQAVWDSTLDSGNGKWKTISTYLAAEETTF